MAIYLSMIQVRSDSKTRHQHLRTHILNRSNMIMNTRWEIQPLGLIAKQNST
jgi:hypothetical protein